MKYIKTFEKVDKYYIYYKRINDYSDDIMKISDILDENNIEYDFYIMSQKNHDYFIIYAYSKFLYSDILHNHNFHYSPSLTGAYGKNSLDKIRNDIKTGNFDPEGSSWNYISKEDLYFKFVTYKFNL